MTTPSSASPSDPPLVAAAAAPSPPWYSTVEHDECVRNLAYEFRARFFDEWAAELRAQRPFVDDRRYQDWLNRLDTAMDSMEAWCLAREKRLLDACERRVVETMRRITSQWSASISLDDVSLNRRSGGGRSSVVPPRQTPLPASSNAWGNETAVLPPPPRLPLGNDGMPTPTVDATPRGEEEKPAAPAPAPAPATATAPVAMIRRPPTSSLAHHTLTSTTDPSAALIVPRTDSTQTQPDANETPLTEISVPPPTTHHDFFSHSSQENSIL